MNRTLLAVPAALLSLSLLAACASPPPPVAQEPAAPATTAAPADTSAADAANAKAAEMCLLTAAAKRARFSGEPAKITVKHILVKHKTAKNPAPGVTRSREEACLRAIEVRDKIRGGADFDALVKEYSEELGAVSRGGSIGSVERKDLAKPFADAAFELGVHQLSDVVESESGFHVIVRTE
jgi:NIMA-interacting peptidyl-prolyl cis-trans isomerase 1